MEKVKYHYCSLCKYGYTRVSICNHKHLISISYPFKHSLTLQQAKKIRRVNKNFYEN